MALIEFWTMKADFYQRAETAYARYYTHIEIKSLTYYLQSMNLLHVWFRFSVIRSEAEELCCYWLVKQWKVSCQEKWRKRAKKCLSYEYWENSLFLIFSAFMLFDPFLVFVPSLSLIPNFNYTNCADHRHLFWGQLFLPDAKSAIVHVAAVFKLPATIVTTWIINAPELTYNRYAVVERHDGAGCKEGYSSDIKVRVRRFLVLLAL